MPKTRDTLEAGPLDRRITLQRRVSTPDSFGGEQVSWADVGTFWARAEPMRAGETFQIDERTNKQYTVFTIRYQPGINSTMLAVYDGEVYNIEGVQEIGRRVGLRLLAFAREVQSGPG